MSIKPPLEERAVILARDSRRKYGVRIEFQIRYLAHFGGLENVSILLPSGVIATVSPTRPLSWEGGKKLEIALEGFATASQAEEMGLKVSQALLMTALSFNFGLRLHYHTREPGTVFDRLASTGAQMWGEFTSAPLAQDVLAAMTDGISDPLLDRLVRLSMEIFAAAWMEPNDRVRFIMLVSAVEPLAVQEELGTAVNEFVKCTLASLSAATDIDIAIRKSLQGRVNELRRESVRRALFRLSETWFPGNLLARQTLDEAYALRSQLLHQGTTQDSDTQFSVEADRVAPYIRRIYEKISGKTFQSPTAV